MRISIDPTAVHRFSEAIQQAIGDVIGVKPSAIVDRFGKLTGSLPTQPQPCEFALIRSLLIHTACRIELATGVRRTATSFAADLVKMASTISADHLQSAFEGYLEHVREDCAIIEGSSRSPDRRLIRALEYLHTNATRSTVSVVDAAHAARMSKWHLEHLLLRHTGRRFRDHVRELRMAEASRLLLESLLSIKEIAARVGYSHVSSFNRQFRRSFRSTATQWRVLYASSEAKGGSARPVTIAEQPRSRKL
ncbi:MAG: helix-turn-helix transcriptional regulator [Vicinamibacterales bacterium]